MDELIKITDNNGKQAVSARELHVFLESKQDFSHWIANRIKKYDLVENEDYVSFDKIIERETGGTKRIEYALSLDAAKELSMVEGNAKGKKARKYFIFVEKQSKELQKPLSPAEALLKQAQLMVDVERRQIEQEAKLSNIENKVNGILKIQATTEAELKALPISTDTLPEMGLRDQVRMLVNRYAQSCNVMQRTVWDHVYQTLYYTYHVSLKSYGKQRKDESLLDVAERNGHMDKIHIIISTMLINKGLSTVNV